MFLTKRNNTFIDNVYDSLFGRAFLSDTLFDRLMDRPSNVPTFMNVKANITQEKDKLVVDVIAPGMKKENFSIDVSNGVLTVKGEVKDEKKEETNDRVWSREYAYSSFSRTWTLPESVKQEEISAEYKDGVLKISLPTNELLETKETKQIEIK